MRVVFPRLNLTQKLILFLILTGVLPLLVVGAIAYSISQSIQRDEASRYMASLVADQKDYLDLQLGQVESLIANISGVQDIIQTLDVPNTSGDAYLNLATQARIGYILNGYTNLQGLVSIDIFTRDGAHYHVGDTLDVSSIRTDVKDRIYAEASSSGQRVLWTGIEDNVNALSSYKKVVTAASILTKTDLNTLQARPVALLLVNYSVDSLYDHFSGINLGQGAYLMVVDGQNRIIYHPDKSLLAATISPGFLQDLSLVSGSQAEMISGAETIVTYSQSERSGWRVLSLIPVNTLLAGTFMIGGASLVMLVFSILAILLLGMVVSRVVVGPVRQITHQFRLLQAGLTDWNRRLPPAKSHDEIGELVQWFNLYLEGQETRQQTEGALRESEERYTLAVRGANDGIWDWNLRTDIIHYSPRWKAMLGCTEDEIGDTPQEWFSRTHPDDLAGLRAGLAAHLAGHTPHFESEHRLLMQDGLTYRWFLARGLAVRDAGQQAHRMAGSLTDITSRKEIEERLRFDAMHDSLTRLPNRAYFMAQLKRSIEMAHRHKTYQGAVLFLDMDRFKIVNDSLGHASGDQMLIVIANRLKACLREEDVIARFGGDEFVMLVEHIDEAGRVLNIAGRIREALAEPVVLKGHELTMTASIGIALINSAYDQPEEAIRDADTALYQAKANGRARYEVFDAAMHTRSVALLHLEADLRRAVERQEFELYYQPIVSLKSGAVQAVEALIRWHHPATGLVSPANFIPLAEETGLIVPMGEWVLHTACAQAARLRQAGFAQMVVSVNISARQFQDARFPALVKQAIRTSGIPGSALELEITESTAMANFAQTVEQLEELRAAGVSISIDDFGTSYSSLGYLKRFPVETIKIDRSFVLDSVADSDGAAITTAIIAMAHILGLDVVAEGVDSQAQLDFLLSQGCDAMQGYLFSPPVPAEALLGLLETGLPGGFALTGTAATKVVTSGLS